MEKVDLLCIIDRNKVLFFSWVFFFGYHKFLRNFSHSRHEPDINFQNVKKRERAQLKLQLNPFSDARWSETCQFCEISDEPEPLNKQADMKERGCLPAPPRQRRWAVCTN